MDKEPYLDTHPSCRFDNDIISGIALIRWLNCELGLNSSCMGLQDSLRFAELGEGVGGGVVAEEIVNENKREKEPCKRIYLHAFCGDREPNAVAEFKGLLTKNKLEGGKGPTGEECLLYTGHVGISFNSVSPIYGFNPDTGDLPGWLVIERLKSRCATFSPYPGIVTNDTSVFKKAKSKGLEVKMLEYVMPESKYVEIYSAFQASQSHTGLTYSFPKGSGDCNCATWPQKIGSPIPSGNGAMRTYMKSFDDGEVRCIGECCDE